MAIDPITAALEIGDRLIQRLWPDPAQRDAAKLELLRMQQTGELAALTAETDLAKAQIAVNQAEAASDDNFTRRARPFVLWVCGVAFAYVLVVQPFLAFLFAAFGHPVQDLPEIDTNLLGWALGGILGLGGLRTAEKIRGVTK